MIDELTGVVLAGGRSRRFGSDKAFADWQGRTLVEAAADSLLRVLPDILVVTKDPPAFAFMESRRVRIVEDFVIEAHPLGGIYTALRRLKTRHAFICACDMPFVAPRLIEALWAARGEHDAVIPIWGGTRQGLCGIYSRRCAGKIRSSIARGEFRINALFDSVATRFYSEAEIKRSDFEGRSFQDIDTREDYARAKSQAAFQGGSLCAPQ